MQYPFWVDSHCHLDFPDFNKAEEGGVAAFVDRARLNRVGAMLTISTHTQRLERYTKLADSSTLSGQRSACIRIRPARRVKPTSRSSVW
jgi:Tat protein secretion system quality control protein TatD with DNase activity